MTKKNQSTFRLIYYAVIISIENKGQTLKELKSSFGYLTHEQVIDDKKEREGTLENPLTTECKEKTIRHCIVHIEDDNEDSDPLHTGNSRVWTDSERSEKGRGSMYREEGRRNEGSVDVSPTMRNTPM
ncbi:hypothetical protein B9Z55_024165 [Caenorhabditis nigoni]|uniref:Uncharacterized protein n=1 Tax=Caenorhabditis nigoni TaxID=1611254 RepID=A0A2G5STA6_9PELO|nr:hypothetical protein B9Z55_024165 [Caenorhabditis nigoni]